MLGERADYDYLFKLVLVGDSGVGKSSLLSQFINEETLQEPQPTIGLEFYCKTLTLTNGVRVRAQVWDTAGQEKYRAITTAHYRRAAGVLIVFDLTNLHSFRNVKQWLRELYQVLPTDTPILLIGNKLDLDPSRLITVEAAKSFAFQSKLLYTETSAFSLNSVKTAFYTLIETLYQRQVGPLTTEGSIVLTQHGGHKTQEKAGCC